jgi:hypothetical protein
MMQVAATLIPLEHDLETNFLSPTPNTLSTILMKDSSPQQQQLLETTVRMIDCTTMDAVPVSPPSSDDDESDDDSTRMIPSLRMKQQIMAPMIVRTTKKRKSVVTDVDHAKRSKTTRDEDDRALLLLCVPKKEKKCVQFNMSATTVYPLDRISFIRIIISNDNDPINTTPTTHQPSLLSSSSTTATLHDVDDVPQKKGDMWYSRKELHDMKLRALYTARHMKHLDDAISEAYYNVCCSSTDPITNDTTIVSTSRNLLLQRLIDAPSHCNHSTNDLDPVRCPPPSSAVASSLQKWSDYLRQRGLERWSSIGLSIGRSSNLSIWKANFFLEQSEQIRTQQSDPIRLGHIYQTQCGSIVSSQFAQVLATIDAYHP